MSNSEAIKQRIEAWRKGASTMNHSPAGNQVAPTREQIAKAIAGHLFSERCASHPELMDYELADIVFALFSCELTRKDTEIARLTSALEGAEVALEEAGEAIADWGAYAGQYLQMKCNWQGDIDAVAAVLTAIRTILNAPHGDGGAGVG